ncbi:hypothetical protein [Glutamicibacter uratoxydans]|uniref:hypothetical protein n=1 Tax=Glutamicibacter uratoxydans TaxID=43667 RepID=UPI001476DFEE
MEYKTQNQITEQMCKQLFEALFRILGYRTMFLNEGQLFDVFHMHEIVDDRVAELPPAYVA